MRKKISTKKIAIILVFKNLEYPFDHSSPGGMSPGQKVHIQVLKCALVCAPKHACTPKLVSTLVFALVCAPRLACALICAPNRICTLLCAPKLACALLWALICAPKLVLVLLCAKIYIYMCVFYT